ncbi:MAG: restriction endonuclease [Candidatus Gracilibacteria bacterium]|nr:restriction endonuclease [Candidatus Gracilibacteria bacterium]
MKINKLDLAKIISDFMFLGVDSPEEKAKVIFKVKHKLTAHGFEKYMQYYFQIKKGYKVKLNGNTNQFDGGIDLKGIKVENGVKKYLVVQCKKYSIKDITENNIRSFQGGTIHKYAEYKNDTDTYYITTSKFTDKAEKFAKEVGIKAIDFSHLYDLQKSYPIEQFEKDLKNQEGIKEYNKSFNQDQMLLELNNQVYDTIGVTDKDVFQLLKQVRRDYSYSKQLRLGDIARNDTLELLARKRPHNLQVLKETVSHLSTREKNKLMKHGNIFIERLKYIHNEEEIETEIEKGFFSKLVEFIK